VSNYDTVRVYCPCGKVTELQTKRGPCTLSTYKLGPVESQIPSDVGSALLGLLRDATGSEVRCRGCGARFGVMQIRKPATVLTLLPEDYEPKTPNSEETWTLQSDDIDIQMPPPVSKKKR
jgi:hypothetical protein